MLVTSPHAEACDAQTDMFELVLGQQAADQVDAARHLSTLEQAQCQQSLLSKSGYHENTATSSLKSGTDAPHYPQVMVWGTKCLLCIQRWTQ